MKEIFHISRMSAINRVFHSGNTHEVVTSRSVLDRNRRPLGYLDVAQLKAKWEAGQANPVCDQTRPQFN